MRAFLFLLFALLWHINGLAAQSQGTQDTLADKLDNPPYFQGCTTEYGNKAALKKCSDEKMMQFIANSLKYPAMAAENNLQGIVIVGFEIDKTGNVINANILRDIGHGCGKAALDVVNKMPQWTPAQLSKEAVRFKMQLPVRFAINNDQLEDTGYSIHWGKNNDKAIQKEALLQLIHSSPIMVRDNFGNSIPFVSVKITLEKGRKVYTDTSADTKITPKMKKIAQKAKTGNTFILTLQVIKDGKTTSLEKVYNIK